MNIQPEVNQGPGAPRNVVIKIDFWSVVKLLLVLLLIVALYLIRDIILLILTAIIIAFIFTPLVDWLEKKKVPRLLTTILIYLFILLVVVGLIIPLGPVLSHEVSTLLQKLPDYYDKLNQYFSISDKSWDQIARSFFINWINTPGAATKGLFGILGTVLGGVVATLLVFVISFYLTLQRQTLQEVGKKILPKKYHAAVGRMVDLMQKDVGGWAQGLLIIAVMVGILNYIGLLAVGVKFALLLAVLGAMGMIIPWVGTWVASILAVLVALLQSPLQALIIAIYYLLVQEFTGHIVFPKLMQRTVGLDPIVVIVVALIGARLGGAIGLILAIPILTIIIILVKEYLRIKQEKLLDKS